MPVLNTLLQYYHIHVIYFLLLSWIIFVTDLAQFAGVKDRLTPTIIVTMCKVEPIRPTPGKQCNFFFGTFLDDGSTDMPVRAAVFNEKKWQTQLKKLEFKKVVLKAGHYYVKKQGKVHDLENDFEIRYKFLPVLFKKLSPGKKQKCNVAKIGSSSESEYSQSLESL